MEAQVQEVLSREAEWAEHKALLAKHDVQKQVDDSLKLSKDKVANPKGVVVIINGWGQNVYDERNSTTPDNNQQNDQANKLREDGYVVIEVNGDAMAEHYQTGMDDISTAALKIVADAVAKVSGNGSLAVSIEGYSRGGGAAVALTNYLADNGMVSSSRIQTIGLDPHMGAGNDWIHGDGGAASVFQREDRGPIGVGDMMMGIGNREIYVARRYTQVVVGPTMFISHGMVDTYGLGFLDEADALIRGWH